MPDEAKFWWDTHGRDYQGWCDIPIEVHYGPGSPNEKDLGLIGPVDGKSVLEIGCGGAQCGIAFAKQGATVIGVDISDTSLSFARELAKENGVDITFIHHDIADLSAIPSESQDVVFSAYAFGYVDDLESCFRETHRVLKDDGVFVWSDSHPAYRVADSGNLSLKASYFDTGKFVEGEETGCAFASNRRTIGQLVDMLTDARLVIDRLLEPDSRKKYPYDPWYGKWDYTPELMAMLPPTIIFKCRKKCSDRH